MKGGAVTQLYLATSEEIEERDITGQFYIPVANPSIYDAHVEAHVANRTLTSALWKLSDELTEKWVQ